MDFLSNLGIDARYINYSTPSSELILYQQRLMISNCNTYLLAKIFLKLAFWLTIYSIKKLPYTPKLLLMSISDHLATI